MAPRATNNEYDIEPVHDNGHRRKHASKGKSVVRAKNVNADAVDGGRIDGKLSSPSVKLRRHRHREMEKFVDENEHSCDKYDNSAVEAAGN